MGGRLAIKNDPEWLTTGEFGRRAGVDRRTVWRWIKAGQLRAKRVGGRYRVHVSELSTA